MALHESELILNPDGSIYHLKLLPEDIAQTVIVVGDPNRVSMVAKYFDRIEVNKEKREFLTQTGIYKGKRISVVSTGIGTDNIDIVFNELDALVNIDFKTRKIKAKKKQLNIIRIGTSGAIQKDIPIDSFVASTSGIGFEGLLHFYESQSVRNEALEASLNNFLGWHNLNIVPYAVDCSPKLLEKFTSNRIRFGITGTNSGFYGPQGRNLRLSARIPDFNNKLRDFTHENRRITNLEMETAGIYGLAKLLGHEALSLNVILANRITGEFSKNGFLAVDKLIQYTLGKLA